MWSVGQLAKATGLTVRTLHHYESIGLIVPSEREGNGYRRYAPEDVERLYRIVALREFGLPLKAIGAALDGGDLRSGLIQEAVMHERYYTQEQLDQLARRREELGEEGMAKAQQDWADLIAAVEAERVAGTDPRDPKVQALVDRWTAMIEQFTGGDPGIRSSLKRMYDEQGAQKASRGAISPELGEYLARARS